MSVKGKIAIVTGAGSGIGKATALRFANEGATVACVDINGVHETVHEIQQQNKEAIAYEGNVARNEDWVRIVNDLVNRYQQVDVLANIAGVVSRGPDTVLEQTEEEWDRVLNINLKGTWLGMKNTIPVMIKQGGGKIVNIASLAAHVGLTNLVAYTASKGGVAAITRQAAMDYADKNIQINAVSPGIIQTRILEGNTPEMTKAFSEATPVGRLGRPEEIASMVHFLSTNEADFITGRMHIVDGGWGVH